MINPAGEYKLILVSKRDNWYLEGKLVKSENVKQLLAALKTQPVKQLDVNQVGITQTWLNANAETAFREYCSVFRIDKPSEKQKELFLATFKDLNASQKAVQDYYRQRWTDDYPKFNLKIVTREEGIIELHSDDQHTFMIPWQITRDGKTEITYNIEISRILCNILPDSILTIDKKRICGMKLREEIAQCIFFKIEDEWDRLGAEYQIGDAIAAVKSRYTIVSSKIASMSSIDLDFASGWHATLKSPRFPSNVSIGTYIPVENKKIGRLTPLLDES